MKKIRPACEHHTRRAPTSRREMEQDSHRDNDGGDSGQVLDPMVPEIGRDVDTFVHVMKLVNGPQRRKFVLITVPPVIEEVEDKKEKQCCLEAAKKTVCVSEPEID